MLFRSVGVVSVERAGMASGVNSTFRQVGYATGIAALGSIFSHQINAEFASRLAAADLPGIVSDSASDAIISGQLSAASGEPQPIVAAATAALVDSLNHITLIAAVIAFAAAALCLVLIRQQDFVVQPGEAPEAQGSRAQA